MKICMQCRTLKPLAEFASRSGGRAGRRRRRGVCKACRQQAGKPELTAEIGDAAIELIEDEQVAKPPRRRRRRRRKASKLEPTAAMVETAATATEDETVALPKRRRRRRRGKASLSEPETEIVEVVVEATEDETRAKPNRRRRKRRSKAKKLSVPQVAAAATIPQAPSARQASAGSQQTELGASEPKPARPKAAGRKSPASKPEAPRIASARPKLDPHDADGLFATRQGFIRMRGKTDSGRSYYQEIEPEFAKILVREHAAYVVNRHTIRRIHSNREFRRLILTRDNYTCRFCGQYGDTIDHLLPRAKGGHTTPVNCVCACHECNQSKADRDLEEFTESLAERHRLEPTV